MKKKFYKCHGNIDDCNHKALLKSNISLFNLLIDLRGIYDYLKPIFGLLFTY